MTKIKEYIEYRHNKKIAKRELAKIGATALPTITSVSTNGEKIVKFLTKLANDTKDLDGEKLVELILSEVSTVLQTDNKRLLEILSYIANLSREDIQKIIVDAIVKTMPESEEK